MAQILYLPPILIDVRRSCRTLKLLSSCWVSHVVRVHGWYPSSWRVHGWYPSSWSVTLMAPSRILEGSASGMGRSTECLCYSVDGEFCRKESLRQLFLKILVGSATMAVMINRVPLLLCWRRIRLKESLRQLFLVILVCLSNYGRVDQQSAFVTLLTENFAGKSHFDSSFSKFSFASGLRTGLRTWWCVVVCVDTLWNFRPNFRVQTLAQMAEFINSLKW
jgi:hypothetical protein